MSDKFIPHYLRSIDDTSNDREPYQHQKWSRTAIKAKTNVELRQKFPPFVVSTAISKIVHVNKYTSMKELHLLVNHVQQCTQFTIDTESEKSNAQLALIQIQTIPPRLPLLVILIELQHLSSNNLPTYCICHEQSPYRPGEKWSLQKALIYAAHMFIDKSCTVNNWAARLTSNNSTLSTGRRNKMIKYAIYDCLTATYFIRPVLAYWTFNKLKNTNIIELFTSFKSPSLPTNNSSNKKNKKNINVQKLFNLNDDEVEPISDDDEIYLNQLIEPVTNKQPEYEEISNDEQEMNDKSLVNDIESIIDEDNELIINDNDENKPTNDVERKPTTTKYRQTHQQRSKA
ncbi:unnamed protein product [Rotaria sordida]|uniref:Uncharacterized protein n=1 Tax=Rotaria sordida TaxID=392033 RepID=A0A819VKJ1_9BILA|nr:unnamed protein product [Rotaria sordida]CAF4110248.1 unnamed protein product [Rotaria sordida]